MKDIKNILLRVQEGQGSSQDEQIAARWLHELNKKEQTDFSAAELETISQDVWLNIRSQIGDVPVRRLGLWPQIISVAAAVALVVFGLWFFTASRHLGGSTASRDLLVNDVAPGKSGATITLANGQVIQLSEQKKGLTVGEELKYNDGSAINPSQSSAPLPEGKVNSALLTASTAKGQTYQFILPDQSKVWLNADSKISFPREFKGKQRRISLIGEAYFEIAKDKTRPFIVETDQQQVEVLGTHFNINGYEDQAGTTTTLLEGSVKVSRKKQGGSLILKPNQQAVVNGSNQTMKTNVDVNEATAWKNGDFHFNDEKLSSIVKQLERWYNVEFVMSDELADVAFTGKISRNRKISRVLRMMEKVNGIHFQIKGRRITAIEK